MIKQLWAIKPTNQDVSSDKRLVLDRTLGPWALTALGIGAVIGGGIFVVTGQAAALHAGPAIMVSFIIAAICCAFCALAYAEFAGLVPTSGSAYSYTYATFGELAAWFIGWMLVLEYGVSASAVAVSWGGYFISFLHHLHLDLPLDSHLHRTGSLMNLPAAAIIMILIIPCYIGIRESTTVNNVMVLIKMILVLLVIFAGIHFVNPANWHPFIPKQVAPGQYGWGGIFRGASMVFFAYIGFEAVSVAAQESKSPQRDLPFSMLTSLIICTILYVAMAAVLTGLIPYAQLQTDEPVITAIAAHPELSWLRFIVEIGALVGLASVVLVMLISQPRIFMIMALDGLLPPCMKRLHPTHHTPHVNTVITGVSIAILAAIFPLEVISDLTSMGTLISFATVCAGVIVLRYKQPNLQRAFRVPAAWLVCSAGFLSCLALLTTMTAINWLLMAVWTLSGFIFYFFYGFRHSLLRGQLASPTSRQS